MNNVQLRSSFRLDYLDNLKGFLIICVVLGHVIQFSNLHFDEVPLFRLIYSFHMPLFMWVSGYVNYRKKIELSVLKRRALQLVLPFVAWVTLHAVAIMNLHYWIDVFYDPTISVWFIWDLFLIICFTTGIDYWCEKKQKSSLIVLPLAYVILQVGIKACHTEILGISHTLDLGLFYILGYYMKKYDVYNKFISIKFWGGAIFILFLIGCFFWQRKQPPTFYPEGGKVVMLAYKMLVAFFACVSIPLIFKKYLRKKILFLTYLGQQTLGIYVIHMALIFYVISYCNSFFSIDNRYLEYALITIITLIVTQIINIILMMNKWSRLIFLGNLK